MDVARIHLGHKYILKWGDDHPTMARFIQTSGVNTTRFYLKLSIDYK